MKPLRGQSGVALAVTLLMLGLLTIIGVSAVMLSTTHFRLVGNLQSTNETDMAVRSVIENFVSGKTDDGVPKGPPTCGECTTVAMCVNGRQIDIDITAQCVGNTPADAGGSVQDVGKNAVWDIQGRARDAISGAEIVGHWGLLVPASSCQPCVIAQCTTTPAALTCD